MKDDTVDILASLDYETISFVYFEIRMVKYIISILVFGIVTFANGDQGEAPDNYVQKIVNASQDAVSSQIGQGVVRISKSTRLNNT